MIEAAKVIVPIGEGKEVEVGAIAAELQAFTEPSSEEGIDEVIIEASGEENLFEERILVEAIGEKLYSEVQPSSPIRDKQSGNLRARPQTSGSCLYGP